MCWRCGPVWGEVTPVRCGLGVIHNHEGQDEHGVLFRHTVVPYQIAIQQVALHFPTRRAHGP